MCWQVAKFKEAVLGIASETQQGLDSFKQLLVQHSTQGSDPNDVGGSLDVAFDSPGLGPALLSVASMSQVSAGAIISIMQVQSIHDAEVHVTQPINRRCFGRPVTCAPLGFTQATCDTGRVMLDSGRVF